MYLYAAWLKQSATTMGASVVDDTVRALHIRPSAITHVEGPMLEVQKVGDNLGTVMQLRQTSSFFVMLSARAPSSACA